MIGADWVAQILKAEGVDFMGVIPFNRLEESGAKAGIRPLIFRQERVGVNLADGYSRITNGKKTGVFAMQAGPGAENAFAGVATAYADSVPILLLPASNPRNRHGVHPTFIPRNTYSSVTKWASQVLVPESIPDMMRRAFGQLRNGKQGPVLLELPSDILMQEIPDQMITEYKSPLVHKSAGDPQDIKEAARLLLSAKRPVIQSGQGVLYAEASAELQELAEITGIPVMTTMAGKSSFNETHPLSLGTRSSTTTDMVVHFLKQSDLVLGVGCSFTRIHYGMNLLNSKAIIHITNSSDDLNKDYSPDHAVIGDANLVLKDLISEVKSQLKENASFEKFDFSNELNSVKELSLIHI